MNRVEPLIIIYHVSKFAFEFKTTFIPQVQLAVESFEAIYETVEDLILSDPILLLLNLASKIPPKIDDRKSGSSMDIIIIFGSVIGSVLFLLFTLLASYSAYKWIVKRTVLRQRVCRFKFSVSLTFLMPVKAYKDKPSFEHDSLNKGWKSTTLSNI